MSLGTALVDGTAWPVLGTILEDGQYVTLYRVIGPQPDTRARDIEVVLRDPDGNVVVRGWVPGHEPVEAGVVVDRRITFRANVLRRALA